MAVFSRGGGGGGGGDGDGDGGASFAATHRLGSLIMAASLFRKRMNIEFTPIGLKRYIDAYMDELDKKDVSGYTC